MKTRSILILLAAVAVVALVGCASVANFLESPTNEKILAIASQAGAASLTQQLGTKVTPDQHDLIQSAAGAAINTASTGAVWWFAEWLRSKQSTTEAASVTALKSQVPSPIATAVPALVATGVPADIANEAIAVTVSAVAANK